MSQIEDVKKLRAQIPGKTLQEKYSYLYEEYPGKDHSFFEKKLGINRTQSYQLRSTHKKEAEKREARIIQRPTLLVTESVEVQHKTPSYTYPPPKHTVQTDIDELDEILGKPPEKKEALRYEVKSRDPWDEEEPTDTPPAKQELVQKPMFDLKLSGIDTSYTKTFLQMLGNAPKEGHTYTLEIKLIEH